MNKKTAAAWGVRLGSVALATVVLGSIASNTAADNPSKNVTGNSINDFLASQNQNGGGQSDSTTPQQKNQERRHQFSQPSQNNGSIIRPHTRSRAS